jgi:hypothetical protein
MCHTSHDELKSLISEPGGLETTVFKKVGPGGAFFLKQEGGAFFLSRAIVLQLAVIVYHNLNVTAVLRLTSAHRSNTTCELERVLDGMDSVESDVGGFAPLGNIARNYIQHQRVVTRYF